MPSVCSLLAQAFVVASTATIASSTLFAAAKISTNSERNSHVTYDELPVEVADNPVVVTSNGPVRGFTVKDVRAFRGIPYAAPPLADNRLRPPQPVEKWTSTLDATHWSPSCLQRGSEGTNKFQPTGKAWNTVNVTSSSEDCLYLNVYTPAQSASEFVDTGLLPVMIYWHAGEFRFGSSNDAENAWPYFSHGRVLLVTANVRLGLLGFAALDELRSRDPSNSTGNYGMQDQRAVLRWVQQNIKAFNGDPSRVTIFGESSGGTSVGFHLSSKASAGLFSGAILESPGLTQSKTWEASYTNTIFALSALTAAKSPKCEFAANVDTGLNFLTVDGVVISGAKSLGTAQSVVEARNACLAREDCFAVQTKPAYLKGSSYLYYGLSGSLKEAPIRVGNVTFSEGASVGRQYFLDLRLPSSASAVDCLVNADAGTLIAINSYPPFGDTFYFDASGPTIDGVELTQSLIHQATEFPNPNVAVLGGANLDEGTEFMSVTPPLHCSASAADLQKWSSAMFEESLADKLPTAYATIQQPVPKCYGKSNEESNYESDNWIRAMRCAGESAILCPSREVLKAAALKGQKNTYWYQFVATPLTSANMNNLDFMGSFHGAEVPFVFGDQFEIASDGERALSAAMGCYWTSFAATGNPNNGSCVTELKLPIWPEIGEHGAAMVFSNTTIAPTNALKEDRCDLFAQYM